MTKIDDSRVLLVEGRDDEEVVKQLCRVHGIEVDWTVEQVKGQGDREGVEYLLDQVPVRLKESGIRRLAVIVDADENAQSRWESLRDRLRKKGYASIPDVPDPAGTIIDLPDDFGNTRLGIWIMPNNKLKGMIEDFLAFLVPDDDTMLPRVDEFLKAIPTEHRKFTDTHLPKARMHCYLAVQKNPGMPLGLAIKAKYLDAKQEVVAPFLQWINDVLITDGQAP